MSFCYAVWKACIMESIHKPLPHSELRGGCPEENLLNSLNLELADFFPGMQFLLQRMIDKLSLFRYLANIFLKVNELSEHLKENN